MVIGIIQQENTKDKRSIKGKMQTLGDRHAIGRSYICMLKTQQDRENKGQGHDRDKVSLCLTDMSKN